MKRLAILLVMGLLLVACNSGTSPEPEGPTLGDIPIQPGAAEIEEDVPFALKTVSQSHQITVKDSEIGFYRSDEPLIDTIEYYDDELTRYGWGLIDNLEFGDGGFLRRYHRGQARAIVAFHPSDSGNGTRFMLLQGKVR